MPKVQIEIPLQIIRKAFVIADEELPSDEVILNTLGSDPIDLDVDMLGEDAEALRMAMALVLISQKFDNVG